MLIPSGVECKVLAGHFAGKHDPSVRVEAGQHPASAHLCPVVMRRDLLPALVRFRENILPAPRPLRPVPS